MATTLYCAIADVQNLLSADGVTYRHDDSPPASYGDILDDASREIDWYCLLQYTAAQLALSPTVKHWCAAIAAALLCERRGNPIPRGIAHKLERAEKKLALVQSGARRIPDIAERREAVPVLSNVRTRLDPYPRTVVSRSRSTEGPSDYVQRVDSLDYLDWVI